jgi:hypothetical protein
LGIFYREGDKVRCFPKLADLGVKYFSHILKELEKENIREIIIMASYFPRIVDEDDNKSMYKAVSWKELLIVLNTFQKNKIPSLYGWTVKFY